MFHHLRILSLALFFISLNVSAAQQDALPKRIQASYVVTKNGQAFANVHEKFVVTGNTYSVESTTKGIGVYALLGERKLTSTGKLTSKGLQPKHFELHQGDNAKKALITDFDWPKRKLQMLVKGELKEADLATGTQDLASFAYQFMYLPRPLKNNITVTLTTGKKLNQYIYKVKPEKELLSVAGSQYKTVHLTPINQNKDQVESKELWLDAERNYILVRFLMVDENGAKLEQTLTELNVD
ncbi:MAG: DUF3108 domain-containing protein [Methylotenera sp.]|nr:DUF3108 domain-containing protein [Methylotenera sp.]